jgi:histone-arginine methyltransferase CARM1
MYPSSGSIVTAPFTDFRLHKEQEGKLQFWNNYNFFGINLTPVVEQACDEYFSQAVVGKRVFDLMDLIMI